VLCLVLAGCGDDESTTPAQSAAEPTPATATAPTGASAKSDSDDTDKSAEEPDRAAATVELEDGKFAADAPHTIHVESGVPVEIDFRARDDEDYTVVISGPSGDFFKKVPGGSTRTYKYAALESGRIITVTVGDDKVAIIADATPGP
jgi:hypothetical protein